MKSLFGAILAFFSLSVFANSAFDYVPEEICPEIIVKGSDLAVCQADNAKVVLNAKVGARLSDSETRRLKFYAYDAIELGIIPDADSNTLFFYRNWLVDSAGKTVGIKTINGWQNSEMESRGRVDTRYNLKGQVVSIELIDF